MHSIREFLQQATQAARNTEIHIPDMPLSGIINTPLAIGGTIAAGVVASKLPMRRGETNKEATIKRLGAVAINAAVGVPVAQIAYDLASRHIPYLAKIPSLSLGVGLILGGCGLPIFLALREKLPEAITAGLMAWVQSKVPGAKPEADRPKTSTAPSDEPLETTP